MNCPIDDREVFSSFNSSNLLTIVISVLTPEAQLELYQSLIQDWKKGLEGIFGEENLMISVGTNGSVFLDNLPLNMYCSYFQASNRIE